MECLVQHTAARKIGRCTNDPMRCSLYCVTQKITEFIFTCARFYNFRNALFLPIFGYNLREINRRIFVDQCANCEWYSQAVYHRQSRLKLKIAKYSSDVNPAESFICTFFKQIV
ncbi:hypothetical protein SAMN04488125_12850 [Methylorubrum salsuginis]|uniref:Uncharacterized protein n=1 Tax=Methylorubrum salsuginis TaxID=414703 RepID=A0A1I4LAE9_9HYPH|nr:hypothetical protein SAMN04488125_12850 [Methylorubrum salsuginis]